MRTSTRYRIGLAVVLAVLSLQTQAESQSHRAAGPQRGRAPVTQAPAYVQGEILVRFREGTSARSIAAAHAWGGGSPVKRFEIVRNLNVVRLPYGMHVKDALKEYREHPDVLYAEPNYIVTTSVLPTDPRFGELWGLHNTGQAGGTPDVDLDAPEAWDSSTGSPDVVVAVLDTGIDYAHQDLAANMFRNSLDCDSDGSDDDGNGFVDDCFGIDVFNGDSDPADDNGHGSHVAGTIGAVGNNGLGVAGVNWNVRLMACKFLNASGFGTIAGAIDCLNYVTRMWDRGVNIVATNNSWGGGGFSQALFDAIDAHRQRGILFVAAADNGGEDAIGDDNDITPRYPAGYYLPNVISVAATTRSDDRSSFSNFGRRTVHLGAPGSEILSTLPGDAYGSFDGTSMATPHVTGVVALLKAQDPARDWAAIKNRILAGGDNNAALAETITQKRLNAAGALGCASSTVLSRLRPVGATLLGSVGTPIDLAVLHINCAAPNGNVSVTVDPGAQTLVLLDDGVGSDQAAGDGIYSAQWTPSGTGTFTLSFPDGETVTVTVSGGYTVAPTAFNYRAIGGSSLNLGDDASAVISSPFPILFGGASFTEVFIGSNGGIHFTGHFLEHLNAAIPAPQIATLVAPFWDDLSPVSASQNVFWAVTGTAPNRELVIEWRDVGHFGCGGGGSVRFQVVFFEGSSNILFNYADTVFSGGCAFADRGGSATVGVQKAPGLGTQFSFDTQSLNDGSALLWTLTQPTIDVSPASQDFGTVAVGSSADRTFTVQNTGQGTLTGTASTSAPFSIVSGGSFSLGAGASQAVVVRFSPSSAGTYAGNVQFTSNGGDLSRLVTGTANTPPLGYLDGPVSGASVSGVTPVRGWALDQQTTSSALTLTLLVDGAPVSAGLVRITRNDVCAVYPETTYPGACQSGYEFSWDTSGLTGTHSVAVRITDADGFSTTLGPVTVTVVANAAPFGYLDAPVAGASVSGVTPVRGWALDQQTTSSALTLTLVVDGAPVSAGLVRITRNDVCAVYPETTYPGACQSGYEFSWDTSGLTGTHSVAVRITDADGLSTTLGPVTVTVVVNAAPFGYMDKPVAGASVSGVTPVRGWALDQQTTSSALTLTLVVDGAPASAGLVRMARSDVCAVYPETSYPGACQSGYEFSWDTSGLTGTHSVAVRITDADGFSTTLGPVTVVTAAPFGYLDAPLAGASVSGVTVVRGWALDQQTTSSALTLTLVVDGAPVSAGLVRITRNDVCAVYPETTYPGACQSGYEFSWDTSGLTGTHSVAVRITDADGLSTTLGPVTVTVVASAAPFGYLDKPLAGASVSGVTPVQGWALDQQTVSSALTLALLADGAPASAGLVRMARSDVCAVYPETSYPGACQSGYEFSWDTSGLTGTHSVAVRITDADGFSTTLGPVTVTVVTP